MMALSGFEVTLGLPWAAAVIVLFWILPTMGARHLHNRSVAQG